MMTTRQRFTPALTLILFAIALFGPPLHAQAKKPAPTTAKKMDPNKPLSVPAATMATYLAHKSSPGIPSLVLQTTHGTVNLKATIDETGRVIALEIVNGPDKLWRAAIDTVRNYTYRPYLVKGKPTKVQTTVTVVF